MFDIYDVREDGKGIEADRERIINILRSATDRTLSTWALASAKKINFFVDAPCHAALTSIPKNTKFFASCFDTRVTKNQHRNDYDTDEKKLSRDFTKETGEKFWSFMTGDTSPWKQLFEKSYPERIEDQDGNLVGFFLDPEAAHEKFKLTYNYCIAMRMVGEERSTIKVWSDLVDLGMREADAFYLSRMIRYVKAKNLWTAGGHNDTSHWPLKAIWMHYGLGEWEYNGSFNFKRFREGDFDFKAGKGDETNGWCTAPYRKDFSLESVKEKKEIAYTPYFKIENVIEEFTKWVDEQEVVKEIGKVAA